MPTEYYDTPKGGSGGVSVPVGRLLPGGGKTGEALVKTGDSDYAAAWTAPGSFSLDALTTFLADNSGARTAGTDAIYQSATGDFLVRAELTDDNPRFGFQLPAGRRLVGIYEGGFDVTGDFDASGGNTIYIQNYDAGPGAIQYLIRTEATA